MKKDKNGLNIGEIIRQTEEAGGEMMLCSGDEKHVSFICEMLSELPEENYPKTWEAVQVSREIFRKAEKDAGYACQAEDLMRKGIEDSWEDGFFFPLVKWENEEIQVNYVTTTAQNISEIITVVCLCDTESGEILDRSQTKICYPPYHTVSGQISFNENLIKEGDQRTILQFSGWVTRQEQFKAAVNIRKMDKKKSTVLSAEGQPTSLLDIQVTGPVHSKTEEGSPIVISYGRTVQAGEKIDYSFEPIPKDKFRVPCAGNAKFLDSRMKYKEVMEPGTFSSSQLLLRREGGGILAYKGNFSDHVRGTANGFCWDFNGANWQEEKKFNWDAYFNVKMYLTLQYITNLFPEGRTVIVNSEPDMEADKKIIDELAIYWGCLDKKANVKMADGGYKRMEEMQKGDLVASMGGNLEVAEIVIGTEMQGMWRLYTQRGKGVLATGNHPVITAVGIKQVRELKVGEDYISMEDGKQEMLTNIQVENICECDVVNLILCNPGGGKLAEDAGIFFADGIAVGDNNMQRLAAIRYQEKRKQKYGLSTEWKKDVESAVRQFDYLKKEDILWKQD